MSKRRQHSAEFKARVALEAVKGLKTVNEIARECEVHPVQVSQWKKDRVERLPEVFGRKADLGSEALPPGGPGRPQTARRQLVGSCLKPPDRLATAPTMKSLFQTSSSGRAPVPPEKRFLIRFV
jgi:transposase-like protein